MRRIYVYVQICVMVILSGCVGETVVLDTVAQSSIELSTDESDIVSEVEEKDIYVHVCGEVGNPDVYKIQSGMRVIDAVNMAGGLTENAASSKVNLARLLEDGERLYIPSIDEVEGCEEFFEQSVSEPNNDKININTASKEELMSLNGIGEKRAEDIISYREQHGRYGSIEDIKNVNGIKEALFEKIKDKIRV